LIAALRPDSLLYKEILGTFFREHIFQLSTSKYKSFSVSSPKVKPRISKLHLNFNLYPWKQSPKHIYPLPTSDVTKYFPTGTHIRNIHIEFFGPHVNLTPFYDVTKIWIKYFGSVTTLKVSRMGPRTEDHPPTGRGEIVKEAPDSLKGAIKVANKWFRREAVVKKGTETRWIRDERKPGNCVVDTCEWM
jgi:hypothetical protein